MEKETNLLGEISITLHCKLLPVRQVLKVTGSKGGTRVAECGITRLLVRESHPLIEHTGLHSNQRLHASEGHLSLFPDVVTSHQSL